MWGVLRETGPESSPELRHELCMEFHCHTFCTPGILVNLFLANISEDLGGSSLFSAIAVFLYPPTDVLKILRSLGKSRKSQTPPLTSKEELKKVP